MLWPNRQNPKIGIGQTVQTLTTLGQTKQTLTTIGQTEQTFYRPLATQKGTMARLNRTMARPLSRQCPRPLCRPYARPNRPYADRCPDRRSDPCPYLWPDEPTSGQTVVQTIGRTFLSISLNSHEFRFLSNHTKNHSLHGVVEI